MICATLKAAENAFLRASMVDVARGGAADLVELRIDFVREPDLRALLASRPLPVIVTARLPSEGGVYRGNEEERIALLLEAAKLGADYIDVELASFDRVAQRMASCGKTKIIISFHDMEGFPKSLNAICSSMNERAADIVKIAVRPRTCGELLSLLKASSTIARPKIVIPIGEEWKAFRICYKRIGSLLSYAPLDEGDATAEGQATLREMKEEYHASEIGEKTRIFAIIGSPIARSKSPELFNRLFLRRNINARYLPLPLKEIAGLQELIHTLPLSGLSVTIPHKGAIIPLLDEVETDARSMGAVNTVVRRDGRLFGYNTDSVAAVESIRSALQATHSAGLRGMKALVIGYGGVARAIAWGLLIDGCDVAITGRDSAKASALAGEFRCRHIPADDAASESYRIIVNGTPVCDKLPIPAIPFTQGTIAFDAIYNPPETAFLRRARECGAHAVNGEEMFLLQAAIQFCLFTGEEVSVAELGELTGGYSTMTTVVPREVI